MTWPFKSFNEIFIFVKLAFFLTVHCQNFISKIYKKNRSQSVWQRYKLEILFLILFVQDRNMTLWHTTNAICCFCIDTLHCFIYQKDGSLVTHRLTLESAPQIYDMEMENYHLWNFANLSFWRDVESFERQSVWPHLLQLANDPSLSCHKNESFRPASHTTFFIHLILLQEIQWNLVKTNSVVNEHSVKIYKLTRL
jgi:hypothetical protein